MLESVAFTFVIVLLLSYWITKDIFHPAVVVNGLWAALIILYIYGDHPLWGLSDKFCTAISLWILPFSLITLFLGQIKLKLNGANGTSDFVNEHLYNKLYPYVLLYSVIFILAIIYYAGGLSFVNIRIFMVEEQFPPVLKLLFYLNTAFIVFTIYGLLNMDKLGKKKVLFLLISLLIVSIFKSNKTSFLAIFISILYILKKKGKLKLSYLFFTVIILIGLLSLVTLNRGDIEIDDMESDNVVEKFLQIYLLSPLTAFDSLINQQTTLDSGTSGSGVLAFFYKIFNSFGANFEIAELGKWVMVPLPTNVFTVMRGYYLDGGYFGILAGSVTMGIIWGILYRLQKKNYTLFVVFYATMVSSLFFQSFGDYFFYTFSVTLQYFVFSLIMTRGITLKSTTTY